MSEPDAANQPAVNIDGASPRRLAATELLQGQRTVEIVHNDQIYRLIVTKNDKLILQK
ncbi:MAG: hemin uptake protein HemP [Planctomycetales bacterium]|nr:hemin uptake protein HemP [Planctomycetales bacterium]